MRIAMVMGIFPAVSEAFIVEQITGLMDLGHEVDIFAFKRSEEKQVHADVLKYGLLKKVTYIDRVPEDRLGRIIKTAAIKIRYSPFHANAIKKCMDEKKYGNHYNALDNLFKLTYFLGKPYDVIHCHFGPIGKQLIFLKDILPQTKMVVQFHGYDISRYLKNKPHNVYQDLFASGDLLLPVSEYFRARLSTLGCPQEKIRIHYCGVAMDKFPYKERIFDFSQRIKILSLGRLIEKKGIRYAIEAVGGLSAKFNKIEYIIAGDGEERKGLETLVKQLGLSQVIKFTGSVTQEAAQQYYRDCDIFLAPSVTAEDGDEEGMPVVIKEAMASGAVAVSTYHAGIPETMVNGVSGMLVPEKDSPALAQKLEQLICNPALCSQISQAGRRLVEEKFDQKKLNKKLEEIYRYVQN